MREQFLLSRCRIYNIIPLDGAPKARTVLFFRWKASTEDDAHDSKERSTQEQQLHGLSLSGAPDKGTGTVSFTCVLAMKRVMA